MCGITGAVDFSHQTNVTILKKMTDVLYKRGPDDKGYYFEELQDAQIALGHRRLSILDLSAKGQQPIKFNNLIISYNGEIYNFKEIRKELEDIGYIFDSETDTEVIIKSYHAWGIDAVNKFNGMFAISILDTKKKELILIRDRTGIKPLYFYQSNTTFLFGSEIKSFYQHPSFKKSINHSAVALFFNHGYIPEPHSIYKDTYKLEAGHYLKFNFSTRKLQKKKYWDVNNFYNQPKINISKEQAEIEVESILKSACNYRLISDVPVGVFLSGGYDSSLISALLQSESIKKIKTFSIGFNEPEFNEAHHAKIIANHLGTDHTELYCTEKDASEAFSKISEIFDEPLGDSSMIPTFLVSKLAKESVTVALSADGGDEIFGGYDKYLHAKKIESIFKAIPFKENIANIMKNFDPNKIIFLNKLNKFESRYKKIFHALLSNSSAQVLSLISSVFTPSEVIRLLKNPVEKLHTHFDKSNELRNDLNTIEKYLAIDYKTYQTDNILVKVDRCTMANSLEGREPLLDYRIIEFVAKLESKFKINGNLKKVLLKNITHKYIPKNIMDRPKMGFTPPISKWLRTILKDNLTHYTSQEVVEKIGILKPSYVTKLRTEFLNGDDNHLTKIWLILIFQMWHEKWM
jgi:asparagine synthase (glutamine-hydrolysing)